MYLYFDRDGILKEQITTTPPRVGNSNVNKIYVYFEDMETTNITGAWCRYKQANGIYTENYYYNNVVTEEIPYNQDRDLKFFRYSKPYKFYVFNIPDIVLSPTEDLKVYSVLFSCWFEINGTEELEPVEEKDKIFGLGLVAFAVDPTTATVDQDYNINIAQWNELMKMISGTADLTDIDVLTISFKESETADENGLSMVDNVIYWRGQALAEKSELAGFALDEEVVHKAQNETITGKKTFNLPIKLSSYPTLGENDLQNYQGNLYFNSKKMLNSDALKPTILVDTSAAEVVLTKTGGEVSVLISDGAGSYTAEVVDGYDIVATVSAGTITNIDQTTGEISIIGPDETVTLSYHYEATRYAFKFNIGSDYNGLYVFTFYYLTMLVAIYALTENQVYKFAGPAIQDYETGSVINSLYNMKRVGNDLYIWSGRTEYQLIAGLVGTLAKVKLY